MKYYSQRMSFDSGMRIDCISEEECIKWDIFKSKKWTLTYDIYVNNVINSLATKMGISEEDRQKDLNKPFNDNYGKGRSNDENGLFYTKIFYNFLIKYLPGISVKEIQNSI